MWVDSVVLCLRRLGVNWNSGHSSCLARAKRRRVGGLEEKPVRCLLQASPGDWQSKVTLSFPQPFKGLQSSSLFSAVCHRVALWVDSPLSLLDGFTSLSSSRPTSYPASYKQLSNSSGKPLKWESLGGTINTSSYKLHWIYMSYVTRNPIFTRALDRNVWMQTSNSGGP